MQAAAILLVVISIMEFAARTSWAQKTFTYRSLGNYHYQFEIKWFRLQDYAQKNGGVDVIILGSSLVNTGIDPDIMAQNYYEQTGIHLRIFNFGVEGLTVAPNSVNARLLVDKYHPALLIYVTEMRDYIATDGLDYEQRFLSNPWVQYQQGKFNFTGWLIDHSMALQTYLPYRNWVRTDFPQTFSMFLYRSKNTSASGYEPEMAMGENVDSPPDPSNPDDAQYFKAYGNFQIAPSRLDNLHSILSLGQSEGTQVLVVEMPVHPTFYAYVGGDEVHKQFQQTISSFVLSNGGSVIPAETCNDIPLIGRANRWHLNYLGAPTFSSCLGQQLAILADEHNTYYLNLDANNSK